MFVTTANTLNILPPLLDRMEVIRIPGYTEDEKINIANKYLLPKQIKENGVKENELDLKDGTIREIIRSYTRESGVRNLEREISKITRKVVKKIVNNEQNKVEVDDKNINDFLGIKKFLPYPALTVTLSPRSPSFPIVSNKITSITFIPYY